jgi:hypothetical protein
VSEPTQVSLDEVLITVGSLQVRLDRAEREKRLLQQRVADLESPLGEQRARPARTR